MGVVGAFGAVKRMRFLISDSTSRITALARFRNPEQQACRELSRLGRPWQGDVNTTALAGAWAELSASDQPLASVSVWE